MPMTGDAICTWPSPNRSLRQLAICRALLSQTAVSSWIAASSRAASCRV
ncbi:MAG: hypothetical protein ACLQU1_01865 [Bryobacteraceae bacterium]